MFRIWQLRFMADQEVATSTRILRGYLVGPYAWHLKNNTGDKIWTIEAAVGIGFITGIGSALALVTETFTIAMVFVGLLIVAPFASLLALVYFGAAALVLQRVIRPRINEASKRSQAAGPGHVDDVAPGARGVQGDQAAPGRRPVRDQLPQGAPRGCPRPRHRRPAARAAEVPPGDRRSSSASRSWRSR